MLGKVMGFFVFIFLPILVLAQGAEDIIVPSGYQVRKIASTSSVPDISCWTFDSSGNIVAGTGAGVCRINQAGEVENLCMTRKYGFYVTSIVASPDGSFLVVCNRQDNPASPYSIYQYVPPDQFILKKSNSYPNLWADRIGNYYSVTWYPSPRIIRYDSNFNDINIVTNGTMSGDIVFDNDNNMYFNHPGTGKLYKVAAVDGIPPSDATPTEVATIPNQRGELTTDNAGFLYVPQLESTQKDGDSVYQFYRLLRVDPSTGGSVTFVSGLANPFFLSFRNGVIYLDETVRGVIKMIDASGDVTDLNQDFGVTGAGYVLLGADDRLYTTDFRQRKMFRLNEDGSFEQYGPGIGWNVTSDSDERYIYIGSGPDNALQQILRIDPVAGTRESIRPANNVPITFQSIALDSFGRIGNVARMQDRRLGINIIDLQTLDAKPYVTGLNNTGRGLQFDSQQNLYVKEGQGDGMKKVLLLKDYDPPLDITNVPLFLDFRTEPYPPTIGWYYVNDLEDIYIPLIDTGRILRADKQGVVQTLADGFKCPNFVSVDRYGRMYVSDSGTGVFEITSVQLEIETLGALIQEIQKIGLESLALLSLSSQQATSNTDFFESLVAKLNSAVSFLERQSKVAAIKTIMAFQNEVKAQEGKKISSEQAQSWIKTTTGIIRVLQEL